MSSTINARPLRASLPRLVARVRKGARYTVLYRSQPAFQIAPIAASAAAGRPGPRVPIDVGKDADLVVWAGDPFELTTAADRVFIRGREMPRTTRQTELLRTYRTLPVRP